MEQKYLDFTTACHKKANELGKDYLSRNSFRNIAIRLGIDWNVAKGWINGEVV